MHAWVEFYCTRCSELHRLAFKIVPYIHYTAQHYKCPEGWQPKDGSVCIHDYAIRVAKEGKPHGKVARQYQKGRRYRKSLKSTVYCPKETTTKTILEHLKQYIIEYYRAEPDTVNIEVDFT